MIISLTVFFLPSFHHDHDLIITAIPFVTSLPSHVIAIPCITRTLRYQRPSPRESICTHVSLLLTLLLFGSFLASFSPFFFTAHLTFSNSSLSLFLTFFEPLMTSSFPMKNFILLHFSFTFVLISESLVYEGDDDSSLYLYIKGRQSTVSNVSCCISTTHRILTSTVHKILLASFVLSDSK